MSAAAAGTGSAWTIAIVPALFLCAAHAQDVRGIEICTAEKDMARRTSCLQANIDFLQQSLTKEARRAEQDRALALKEVTTLKADIVALKILLGKAQDEIAALQKKAAEKK